MVKAIFVPKKFKRKWEEKKIERKNGMKKKVKENINLYLFKLYLIPINY